MASALVLPVLSVSERRRSKKVPNVSERARHPWGECVLHGSGKNYRSHPGTVNRLAGGSFTVREKR